MIIEAALNWLGADSGMPNWFAAVCAVMAVIGSLLASYAVRRAEDAVEDREEALRFYLEVEAMLDKANAE